MFTIKEGSPMKNIFVLAIVGAFVLFGGCSDQNPTVASQPNSGTGDAAYQQTVALVDANVKALTKPESAELTWFAPMFDAKYLKHGAEWVSVESEGVRIYHSRYMTYEGVPITGGLTGTITWLEHNADIREATGNGRAWGVYEMTANLAGTGATGVYKGHYYGMVEKWTFMPWSYLPMLPPPAGMFGAGEREIRGVNWYGFMWSAGSNTNVQFTGWTNQGKGF